MKKLLSYFAFFAVLFGFSLPTFAADKVLASYTYGGTTYLAPGCNWSYRTISTPGGNLSTGTLYCTLNGRQEAAAYYEYYGSVGPIQATGAFYATKSDGTQGANTYNYIVRMRSTSTSSCNSFAASSSIFADLSQASYSRALTLSYNPNICGTGCPLNIKAVTGGYQLWCGN